MTIAIIGAGFTGLSAAYTLLKQNHYVTIFEKDSTPGGLAIGFKEKQWEWSLEKHYHHWFTNDAFVLNLAKEISHPVIIKRPKTSTYIDGSIYQLDSLFSLLSFPKLSIFDRLRMATALGMIKYNPFWQPLENIKATAFLSKTMGEKAYQTIWEPLFVNKFGKYANDISLAWFWARIVKRTPSLAYPKGGFLEFANALVKKIEEKGGKVLFNTEIAELKSNDKVSLKYSYSSSKSRLVGRSREVSNETMKQLNNFDRVVVTLPSFLFLKIAPQLPSEYKNRLLQLKGLGATNLILRLSKPFLSDGTYWLNICDKKSPIMAVVEHTNFMDKKYYNNEHIVYLGNYLPHDHPYMKMTKHELLKTYTPYLKKINPNFELCILNFELFKVPFAQPIIPLNYSKIIPPFETPLKNVYLANIQQVYPWDRGTNYAVELGEKVAKLITKI
jgi:protoporphyrinogen oxidase